MIVVKAFVFNLMCSAFSFLCDSENPYPEVRNDPRPGTRGSAPIVELKAGKIRGYLMSSSEGRIIYAFESIPYAEPPVNNLRFQPPVPIKSWDKVLDATRLPPMCLQVNPSQLFRTVGQEDCLYLNVYTTRKIETLDGSGGHNISKKIPVVVWVHGGAFSFGYSGDYGPSYLLNKELVLVTLNYRVGVLGFLSTGDSICPGNNGLKDQALAIKWVYENIEKFGGNVKRITLMGQSAGGVSTHLHMLSKGSRNYFQAAASLSGTAFVHWAIQRPEQARSITLKMARIQGCPTTNTHVIHECLKRQNPVFLVANQLNLQDWTPFPAILFAPVIEQESNASFISAHPDVLYSKKDVPQIPWITSTTSQEGYLVLLLLKGLLKLGTFRREWYKLAPLSLNYESFVTAVPHKITTKVKQFYFGDRSPMDVSLDELSEVFSDRFFTFGFEKGLREHSQIAETYGYLWKYKGKYNIANSIGIPSSKWGVGHGEDVFYIFNSSSSYTGFAQTDPEYVISQVIVNVMHNFFALREPLYEDKSGRQDRIWSPVRNTRPIQVLQFDHDIRMISSPHQKTVDFWLSLNLSDTRGFE
ncbi:unnamed protein product [Allacma fusca]|uniref:Carboxylic ester hydrolase n=1 Tax=Allacma fusca TaxID=39272 RepID=A0A8J2LFU7_9HEXA|nr:unnamed protein product [Allacma fusca]